MNKKELAVIITNRDRNDLTDKLVEHLEDHCLSHIDYDMYVIDMGSEKPSKYTTYHYSDPDFRGKVFGHDVGATAAMKTKNYQYYLIMMNDVTFHVHPGVTVVKNMIRLMNKHKHIGIMSPTFPKAGYPDCKPRSDKGYHVVTTTDYLCFIMRGDLIEQGYFLNPDFKYSRGAIHELSYKLYSNGYCITYCDLVQAYHVGGTTYGATKNTISREEYIRKSREFVVPYFIDNYGKDWDDKFTKALGTYKNEITFNTYKMHRELWEGELR